MSDKILVTGAAGFIASAVAERLIAEGAEVVGIDSFSDFYPRERKEANIRALREHPAFRLVEGDLSSIELAPVLDGVTGVCHLAAQAGVRASWGDSFQSYVTCNVTATQRLLEAVKSRSLLKFVLASSSSVYGDTTDLPMREDGATRPISPYGVTKLAAEHLALLYHRNYGVPAVALRYFTVYGPRQRPDMGFYRFMSAARAGRTITIFGDGEQTRDFTFVADVVDATLSALRSGPPGEILNIGGGSRVTLNHALAIIERIAGFATKRRYVEPQRGDVRDTLADNSKATRLLSFAPSVQLQTGLAMQHEWMESLDL